MIHDTCGTKATIHGIVEQFPDKTDTVIMRCWCHTCQMNFDVPFIPGYEGEKMIQFDMNQKGITQLIKEGRLIETDILRGRNEL